MQSHQSASHWNTLISSDWSSQQLAFIRIIQKGTGRATKRLSRCLMERRWSYYEHKNSTAAQHFIRVGGSVGLNPAPSHYWVPCYFWNFHTFFSHLTPYKDTVQRYIRTSPNTQCWVFQFSLEPLSWMMLALNHVSLWCQKMGTHSHSGQHIPVSVFSYSKQVCLTFQYLHGISLFQFVPFVLSLDTTRESLAQSLFSLPPGIYTD